ncbi:MAG: helix-turn-helix domain-containing protein [Holophagales bacterium]|jgi:transcriptional regulator with XRE-family HTH domain|nr:helix-turn-helix domain-containing protein [Holophagales bacterium]
MRNDSEILRRIGLRIKELRLEKGISQEYLAGKSGVDRTFIGGLERGKRNVSVLTLCEIAHALQIEIVDLIRRC